MKSLLLSIVLLFLILPNSVKADCLDALEQITDAVNTLQEAQTLAETDSYSAAQQVSEARELLESIEYDCGIIVLDGMFEEPRVGLQMRYPANWLRSPTTVRGNAVSVNFGTSERIIMEQISPGEEIEYGADDITLVLTVGPVAELGLSSSTVDVANAEDLITLMREELRSRGWLWNSPRSIIVGDENYYYIYTDNIAYSALIVVSDLGNNSYSVWVFTGGYFTQDELQRLAWNMIPTLEYTPNGE